MIVHFRLNGRSVEVDVRPDEMLLDVLRTRFELTSVRETCRIGVCGACTVLVDGDPISGCLFLTPLAEGRAITTVDGLGGDHPVQRAFEQAHAFQCGYCTPGMILTVKRLLEETPRPSDEQIRVALGGNLCRCGCYVKIQEAAHLASGEIAEVQG
jgi:aerobic-type carbon monoxide dehydrogenase small subunit (CoxS/CutS family)